MRVVGIDPGSRNGAVCLLTGDPSQDRVEDLPLRTVSGKPQVDYAALKEMLLSMRPERGVVERVGGMPGDAPASAFRFGYAAGVIRCALDECCPIVDDVPPGAWKRAAMIFRHAKDESRREAAESLPHLAKRFARKKDVDRADAALITMTFREQLVKNP